MAALVVPLGVIFASPDARADLFALEPGKRIKGHAALDCNKCHTSGSGLERRKCLSCHEHKPLAKRIRQGEGLHSTSRFKKNCEECHSEHKGRSYNPIDWHPVGGMKRFDHGLSGYELEGAHRRVSCKECHTNRFKSGRVKFLGLTQDCLSCHDDVHRFEKTHKLLTSCQICHSFDARTVVRAKGLVRFKHKKVSDFPLSGKHKLTKCTDCHSSTKNFKIRDNPERCVDCHKDIHKNVYTQKSRDCKACHSDQKLKFSSKTNWNHNKKTDFKLRGKHKRISCKQCHGGKSAMKMSCVACHKDDSVHIVNNKDRFKGRDCSQCHTDNTFEKDIRFAHRKETGFTLNGKHASVDCAACHRKKPKAEIKTAVDTFERFKTEKCASCHIHQDAHKKKFHDRPHLCEKCHVPGDIKRFRNPDHRILSSSFAKQGAHAPLACDSCHGEALKNLSPAKDCAECHFEEDVHQGNLGPTCGECHIEGFPWTNVLFDHDEQSVYKLEGKHKLVSCNACHTNAPEEYKPQKQDCKSCHAEQDVHQDALGNACEKCHDIEGGTPLFDHDTMTEYVLEGSHARADCRGCHYLDEERDEQGYEKLDLAFHVQGNLCADCHGDPHGLRRGARCQGCHDMEGFESGAKSIGAGDVKAAPSGDDKTGLKAKSKALPTKEVIAPDAKGASIVDGGALPSASADAGTTDVSSDGGVETALLETPAVLHSYFLPRAIRDTYHDHAPFNLRDGHSRLDCKSCHQRRGDLMGQGQMCDTCHRQDDIHVGSLGGTCADCHSTRTWMQPRFTHTDVGFSLEGAHRLLSCKQCHSAGNYMGLTTECIGCHLDDAVRAGTTANVPHDSYIISPCINCHHQMTWNLSFPGRGRF
ncbi:MAG: hypothetical protein GY822_09565 [Deltaproteobacteria bacterium]|nr:hypothetical protein [Deltaproteobacteria bacterium]